MKNILSSLGIAVPILLFSSCQKEIDWGISQGVTQNEGTLLSKYIELDTALPSGQDTANIYTFSYDNLKRIKRIYQVRNFIAYSVTYYITTEFFYKGTDAMPYKTIESDQEDLTYVDTSFYSYSNGFVSTDSSVIYRKDNNELIFTSVISFSGSGNNIFVRFKESYPGSVYEDSAMITITRQNGNIITQDDPNNNITEDLQLTYDSKVNPFYKADIHYPIYYEHLINSFRAQNNNLIEGTFSSGSIPNRHVKYSYTYRSDGYPLTVTKINLLDPAESRKGLFFYTK